MTGTSDPSLAFVQEPGKTTFRDAVDASQVPLRLVPKVLNTIDVVPAFPPEGFAVTDTRVMKLRDIQHVVHLKAIGGDAAIRGHFLLNDGNQGLGFGVRDDYGIHLPASRSYPKDRHFLSCTPSAPSVAHPATATVQGRTVVVFFQRLRQLVTSKQEGVALSGEIEADERD